jgi:hypothetical protein
MLTPIVSFSDVVVNLLQEERRIPHRYDVLLASILPSIPVQIIHARNDEYTSVNQIQVCQTISFIKQF